METEILKIKEAKPSLDEKTLVNYNNLFKRLDAVLDGKSISKMKVDEIVDYINKVKTKKGEPITPSVKASLLNVALVIKEVANKDDPEIVKLKDERKKLYEDTKTHIVEKTNVKLKETLPSVKRLNEYLESLYTEGKWRAYIMNYLMMTYGIRNLDLDLEFIGNKKEKLDMSKNYLVVEGKNQIKYQRGNYKTVDTYGLKVEEIKNKKFTEAVKNVMENADDNKYLLSLGNNKHIAETSLSKFISKHTLNNIGQGNIFKIMNSGKPKAREELSASRGTDEKTVSEVYDLNHKDAKGKAKKRGEAAVKAEAEKEKPVEASKEAPLLKKKVVRKKKQLIIMPDEPEMLKEDW